jgi:hypothetical protein
LERFVLFEILALDISEAINGMVVDHPRGLHVGITDGWANKLEATLEQVFAHGG